MYSKLTINLGTYNTSKGRDLGRKILSQNVYRVTANKSKDRRASSHTHEHSQFSLHNHNHQDASSYKQSNKKSKTVKMIAQWLEEHEQD